MSPTADIPSPFRQGQVRAGLVQQVLDRVEPWRGSDGTVLTVELSEQAFPVIIVSLDGRKPVWAKHVGHHAHHVQVSPFVECRRPLLTQKLTIELVGSASHPRLVRAYPGDYAPPLPWQNSAEFVPGGVAGCVEFWRTHAYVLTETNTVPGSSIGYRAPSWFLHPSG